MAQNETGEKRDMVLAPGQYAYLQDETRGQIKTHSGPTVINQTAQDRPVTFDAATQTFRKCTLEQAVSKSPLASEGDYIILENPALDNSKPEEGQSRPSPVLKYGSKINIPGPCTFSLWPGQRATVIKGHHLRSNQYLVVRVYNQAEARQNWGAAVAVRAAEATSAPATSINPANLTIGQLLIIKGTEVSFYIPPTGVEVQQGENDQYVRDALTLERLEYCLLIDEDGNKRYERGPQVVFPKPTENFYTEKGSRKFKAIELNPIQGLHLKAIAEYTDGGRQYQVGDELFITGKECSIYYPEVHHSVIKYGERTKHYATAIPAGEARYLMNRETGEIKTVRGPCMLLPDPRKEVMVRRVLSDKQCGLWYPGNAEALAYNQTLRAMMRENPSARSGFVSEGDVAQNVRQQQHVLRNQGRGRGPAFPAATAQIAAGGLEALDDEAAALAEEAELQQNRAAEPTGSAAFGNTFARNTNYTTPRTVTLDTKYEGVPAINVFTGYACMVVSKTGKRRVEKGPCTILLDYDESLEVLELSTGKPKTTDNLQKTVYLRVANNKVSDVVSVTTGDHVKVQLRLSYCVNFEGPEESSWFAVENYIKFLCDHSRSLLKGMAQKKKVEDFHNAGVDIVRDFLLGGAIAGTGERSGLVFKENWMRVYDVEVLGIEVEDAQIAEMLNKAQHEVVRSNIQLHQAEKKLDVTRREEQIARETEECKNETIQRRMELEGMQVAGKLVLTLNKIAAELKEIEQRKVVEQGKQDTVGIGHDAELNRKKSAAELDQAILKEKLTVELQRLAAESESTVTRFGAAQSGFSEALLTLGNQQVVEKVAEALSVQRMIGGNNFVDAISKMFEGTPVQAIMKKVIERSAPPTPAPAPTDGGSGRRGR